MWARICTGWPIPPFSMSLVDAKVEEGEGLVGGTEENFLDCLSDGEGEIGNLGQISGQIPIQILDQNMGQDFGQIPNLIASQNLVQISGQILNQILDQNLGLNSGQILNLILGENHVQISDIGTGRRGGRSSPPLAKNLCLFVRERIERKFHTGRNFFLRGVRKFRLAGEAFGLVEP